MFAGLFKGVTSVFLVATLCFATNARAGIEVHYEITGVFSKSNTSSATFATGTNSTTISFESVEPKFVDAPPTAFVDFGAFKVTSTVSNTDVIFDTIPDGDDDFTLTIKQTSPTPTSGSPAVYFSELRGKIRRNSSGAYIQFSEPLTKIMTYANGFTVYSIVSADSSTPGRVNLKTPGPNGSTSYISGSITAVPEPATVLSLLVGIPLLGLGAWARKQHRNS